MSLYTMTTQWAELIEGKAWAQPAEIRKTPTGWWSAHWKTLRGGGCTSGMFESENEALDFAYSQLIGFDPVI